MGLEKNFQQGKFFLFLFPRLAWKHDGGHVRGIWDGPPVAPEFFAAIDGEDLSGDVGAGLTGEVGGHPGNLGAGSRSFHGDEILHLRDDV